MATHSPGFGAKPMAGRGSGTDGNPIYNVNPMFAKLTGTLAVSSCLSLRAWNLADVNGMAYSKGLSRSEGLPYWIGVVELPWNPQIKCKALARSVLLKGIRWNSLA